MRIVKLSTDEFESVEKVVEYFEETLPKRRGKFRIPAGWIAEDGLRKGERMLFSYKGTVIYSARARTGRCDNHDRYSVDYPYYFRVDVPTIRRVEASLEALEEQLRATGRRKNIVHSHGWPTMPDSPLRNDVWSSLRGESLAEGEASGELEPALQPQAVAFGGTA